MNKKAPEERKRNLISLWVTDEQIAKMNKYSKNRSEFIRKLIDVIPD